MNKKKGLLTVAGLSVLAAGLVVGAVNNNAFRFANAEQTEVNFATAEVTRRFYFVIDGYKAEWNTSGQELHVHAWGGSLAAEQWSAKATKMYGDYGTDNQGLWFADITAVGIGSAVNAQVKRQGGNDAWSYSKGLALPSLGDKTNDVMYLLGTADESGNRNASLGTAGGTSGQVASFLNFVSTCTTSYANGFNAYPQLKANFLDPSAGEITAYGGGTYVEDKDDKDVHYTLNQKIAELEAQYNAKGWFVA